MLWQELAACCLFVGGVAHGCMAVPPSCALPVKLRRQPTLPLPSPAPPRSHWRSRTVACPHGSGRPACETVLLHYEDFRINERLAR